MVSGSRRAEPERRNATLCNRERPNYRWKGHLLGDCRRPEDRELIRDLDRTRTEAGQRRGTAPSPPVVALLARVLEQPAAKEHALEVRRRHLVSQRGAVQVPELGHRE